MRPICAFWLAAFAIGLAAPVHAEPFPFRRGIGLSHSMAWAQVAPPPSTAFVDPPFADRALRDAELLAIRRAGFDFVRFAVDPGPFLHLDGARRERLDRMLLDQVGQILLAGLAVVVEFHPSDLHPHYTGRALTAGPQTPVFQGYLRLLERTAALLDRLGSDRVGLELMNEPPGSTEAWQPMQDAAYRAARRQAPRLPLVLTGGLDGMPEGLLTLRTEAFRNDPAVLYTFHYYEPFQFTHQGAPWNAARYLADVPYPATARPLRDSLDATAAAIAAASLTPQQKLVAASDAWRHLESYRRSGFDRSAIARSLDRVVRWGRANGVSPGRILLGEFGVRKSDRPPYGIRAAERRQWFADVRAEAEARGFIWAVWVYSGSGGFALVEERGVNVETAVTEALGLGPYRRGMPAN